MDGNELRRSPRRAAGAATAGRHEVSGGGEGEGDGENKTEKYK